MLVGLGEIDGHDLDGEYENPELRLKSAPLGWVFVSVQKAAGPPVASSNPNPPDS